MDKIETYIQNVFSGWPEAEVVTKTKSNLQSLMKTHYERLLSEGKNEDEAFGLVVSQFGNVEELKASLGVDPAIWYQDPLAPTPLEEYRAFKTKYALAIAAGVCMFFLGIISLLFLETFFGADSNIPVIAMLLFMMLGVAIIIVANISNSKFADVKASMRIETDPKAIAKRRKKTSDKICSLIMCIATLVFFLSGSLLSAWHPAWVVFPIGGILCGIVDTILKK